MPNLGLQATVTDNGDPALLSTAQIIVSVVKAQPNPTTVETEYEADLLEGTMFPSFLTVEMEDNDATIEVQFLLSSTTGNVPFTIDAQNGSISTSEPLDREDQDRFEFTAVIAQADDASVLFGLVRIVVTVRHFLAQFPPF